MSRPGVRAQARPLRSSGPARLEALVGQTTRPDGTSAPTVRGACATTPVFRGMCATTPKRATPPGACSQLRVTPRPWPRSPDGALNRPDGWGI